MASLNKVFLIGNLTRDPDLRYTPGGAAVCSFGVAVNRRYTTARGEDREDTCFVDVDAWGKWGEACNTYLRKGSPVLIEGRLRLDQWEDRETGARRSKLMVVAEHGQFLGRPRSGDFDDGPPESGPPRRRGGRPEPSGDDRAADQEDAPEMPPFEDAGDADDDIPF